MRIEPGWYDAPPVSVRPVPPRGGYRTSVKRGIDVTVAVLAMPLVLPLLALLALLVFASSPGPVFFRQWRVGHKGRPFRIVKLRTMVPDAEAQLARVLRDPVRRGEWEEARKLRDDPRSFPVGRFLRRSSLDELPQLLNVVRGDMSLVGPRPIVEEEAVRYGSALHDYTAMRPGVTGYWQVHGRSDTSYPERVALDQYYVRNCSLRLDLLILLHTVATLFRGHGAY